MGVIMSNMGNMGNMGTITIPVAAQGFKTRTGTPRRPMAIRGGGTPTRRTLARLGRTLARVARGDHAPWSVVDHRI